MFPNGGKAGILAHAPPPWQASLRIVLSHERGVSLLGFFVSACRLSGLIFTLHGARRQKHPLVLSKLKSEGPDGARAVICKAGLPSCAVTAVAC